MLRTYPVDRVACPILQPYFNAMLFGQAIRATSYPALHLAGTQFKNKNRSILSDLQDAHL